MIDQLYVKLYQKSMPQRDLQSILRIFYEIAETKSFSRIDKIISEVNVRRIEDDIIIALVRCLTAYKSELLAWKTFISKVEKHLLFKDKKETFNTIQQYK